jgi:hypothetical protein
MNIAGAYPAEAGVSLWQRTVGLSKTKVEVTDHYKGAVSFRNITQTFMTVCPTDIDPVGRIVFTLPDGGQTYLDYDPGIWKVRKEKMELTTPEDQGLKTSWKGAVIWRILLIGQGDAKEVATKYFISY